MGNAVLSFVKLSSVQLNANLDLQILISQWMIKFLKVSRKCFVLVELLSKNLLSPVVHPHQFATDLVQECILAIMKVDVSNVSHTFYFMPNIATLQQTKCSCCTTMILSILCFEQCNTIAITKKNALHVLCWSRSGAWDGMR